jgi:hypothetical protein
LLTLSRLAIQFAETSVTVRLKGTHAEFVSQGEGLKVVGCGLLDAWGIAMYSDVAEEPQSIRLLASLLTVTRERKSTLCDVHRVIHTAS